ncbi:MAG: phenylacetic acid degradation operon negative regulatory protein PaaX [Gammaproteobacteria bacterium]|nr:phenylacetic acid degradation operon negative regulatory protein PaaX [Gammaproteobacteria bacterium]MCP5201021.1 phenylacetic acid degradation operon negative regulatory protein PaaX [Gammaproteobacteria bacterium]
MAAPLGTRRAGSAALAGDEQALARHLDTLLAATPPRAGSLVITLFGDVVSAQGGAVWLGGLVDVLAGFGLNARQVRTAVFRLAQDGWLSGVQRGRRSYYRLTPFGQRQYARAAQRIYAAAPSSWDGDWTLVMPAALDAAPREELRKRLAWLGFGSLAPGILAHPRADAQALADVLDELELGGRVSTWRARTETLAPLRRQIADAWQLGDARQRLDAFIADFAPCADLLAATSCPAATAFRLRVLLIHEYRRILLRSADLPGELLPADWPGHAARALVTMLYRRVHAAASAQASAVLCDADGPLPPPGPELRRRFGGLDD